MRDDSSQEDSSSLTWSTLTEQGKAAFEQGDYSKAIKKYSLALQPDRNCPASERQILLSNLVAARLQIGGPTQAEAAVENAKQCVALNDRWAKGHVRLASAYIALGGHSNDACNALQRALQLDPLYPNARQMLLRELRREHSTASNASDSSHDSSVPTTHETPPPQPSAPPQHLDDRDYSRQSSYSHPEREGPRNRPPENPYRDQTQQPPPPALDENFSIHERVWFYFHRARMWYSSLSEDSRTLLKVVAVLVVLYVAFGGRFGLEALGRSSNGRHRRGNYASGNAYDQYYQRQQPYRSSTTRETGQGRSYQYSSHSDRHHSSSHGDGGYDYTQYDHDDYYSQTRPTRGSTMSSFHLPNLFDGSLPSMLLLAAVAYICHRNGLNPMQVLFFLNLMNGGRRRQMGMFGGYGGMGGFGPRRW